MKGLKLGLGCLWALLYLVVVIVLIVCAFDESRPLDSRFSYGFGALLALNLGVIFGGGDYKDSTRLERIEQMLNHMARERQEDRDQHEYDVEEIKRRLDDRI